MCDEKPSIYSDMSCPVLFIFLYRIQIFLGITSKIIARVYRSFETATLRLRSFLQGNISSPCQTGRCFVSPELPLPNYFKGMHPVVYSARFDKQTITTGTTRTGLCGQWPLTATWSSLVVLSICHWHFPMMGKPQCILRQSRVILPKCIKLKWRPIDQISNFTCKSGVIQSF